MNRQDRHLLLFRRRSLSEMMGATTDFLRRHRLMWLLYVGLPLLPCCLLLALMKSPNEDAESFNVICSVLVGFDFDLGTGIFTLEALLFTVALTWVLWSVHALLRLVVYSPGDGAGHAAVRASLRRLLPKACVLFVVVYVAARLLDIDLGLALLLILLLLPLSFFPPAWMLHDDRFDMSLSRSLNIAFSQWGYLVVVILVMGFMVFMLRGTVQLPTLLLENSIDTLTQMDERPEGWYLVLQYIAETLSWWAFFMGLSILAIAVAYVYGNGVEKENGDSLVDDIYQFENL